ncbi:DNA mismatch repair protein C-terminal [Penicillium malachiteum]|uniref:DNA mismatch repair protein C-terminal n=1 Tax=Penicillium malachiteum TaxID=1324776 RepID=A0AAD6MUY8_9EURO|nr:DNA mismatch repair protein C-terminal [Penicillium malachiteum]
MPIEALPQATVRAIGSTSVISDPCSVVKELIDNALDAGASSLFIEISPNTVDVIQLKDNGHGIPAEDHPSVCRHTFTSKIRTAEDLRNVGGSLFGFRGEALASIAEMSGGITVTTRVASSVTGSCVKYQRDGELLQSTLISHPVGTTVRVVDFLKHIPVRKQVVLKSAIKILTKIKKLLHSYAIAQPSKRFSLKVLKAKNENNNWVYAPASDETLSDAAVKVFGRELSSSCTFKIMSSKALETQLDEGEYNVSCLLPKPDSDLAKVSNSGQFLSVDGRPLSTATGIGQDIGKLFKSYIRATALRNEVTKSITDPFLCLQLSCPQGSYDVNIEPSKDDVLFEERDIVFSLIEALFEEHYGQLGNSRKPSIKKKNPKIAQAAGEFNLLLSRTRPSDSSEELGNTEERHIEPITNISTIQATPCSQSSLAASTPGLLRHDDNNDVVHVTAAQVSTSINPWSVSRRNSTWRTPRRESTSQTASLGATTSCESTPRDMGGISQTNGNQQLPSSPEFPSPPISRITSTSPINRRRQISSSQLSIEETGSLHSAHKAATQRDKERYGSGALDTWFTRTTQASMMQDLASLTQNQPDAVPTLSQLAEERFGKGSRTAPEVTANANPTRFGGSSLEAQTQPSQLDEETTNEVGYEGSMDSGRGFPVLERWAASLKEGFNSQTQSELEKALDFEKRKKEAIQRYRNRTVTHSVPFSSQASTAVSHSQHHNRFLKAKAALLSERPFAVEAIPKNALAPQDPRAYLIRCSSGEASTDSTKSRRAHKRRLPFERIPEGHDIHDLSLTISTDSLVTKESLKLANPYDSYMCDGSINCGFASSDVESLAPFWNERIRTMIKQNYKEKDGSLAHELIIDTSSLIANHLKEFPEA